MLTYHQWGYTQDTRVSARQESMHFCPTKISLGPHFISPMGPKTLLYLKSQCHHNMKGLSFGLGGPILTLWPISKEVLEFAIACTGWKTKKFWHSPELGSLLYSLYKIPLAQACFPLTRPNFHSHWRALVSQPACKITSTFLRGQWVDSLPPRDNNLHQSSESSLTAPNMIESGAPFNSKTVFPDHFNI